MGQIDTRNVWKCLPRSKIYLFIKFQGVIFQAQPLTNTNSGQISKADLPTKGSVIQPVSGNLCGWVAVKSSALFLHTRKLRTPKFTQLLI